MWKQINQFFKSKSYFMTLCVWMLKYLIEFERYSKFYLFNLLILSYSIFWIIYFAADSSKDNCIWSIRIYVSSFFENSTSTQMYYEWWTDLFRFVGSNMSLKQSAILLRQAIGQQLFCYDSVLSYYSMQSYVFEFLFTILLFRVIYILFYSLKGFALFASFVFWSLFCFFTLI